MADDDQYAGSDTPQTADQQKQSDQQFLEETPAPRAEPVQPSAQGQPSGGEHLPSISDMYRLGLQMYMDSEKQIEDNNKRLQPLYEKLNQSLSQPLPQLPQFQQVPSPPSQQQLDQRLNKGRFEYLAIGLPLAYLLGRRGKNAAFYAMGAFGQGLTQLQQNNMQGAREMFSTWQEAAKYAQEENTQRLDMYRLVLENQKLNLGQQTALIENISRQLNDPPMQRLAAAKDFIGITNELAKAEQTGNEWTKKTDEFTIGTLDKMATTSEGQAYRSAVIKAGGHDPFDWKNSKKETNEYDGFYKEAEKTLNYEKWNEDYWKKRQGLGGTDENQEYIDANKKLGVEGVPHVDNDAAYNQLPHGAFWTSSDGIVHGPKP
jgi:hypothetical protein